MIAPCSNAAANGHLECLKYLRSKGWAFDSDMAHDAAKRGQLNCLKYFVEEVSFFVPHGLYNSAAGHLDCLMYLHKMDKEYERNYGGGYWNVNKKSCIVCTQAAIIGNIKCLMYLHENGWPLEPGAVVNAAARGNLECLEYLHKAGCQLTENACILAAKYGRLGCLKYLFENGCPYPKSMPTLHMDCADYIKDVMLKK